MTPWVHVSGSENAGECRCWVLGRCLWTAVRRRTDAGQGFNTSCDSAKGPALWVRVMSSLESRLVNHICTLALNSTNFSGAEVCHLIIFECLGENVDHTAYEYSQTGWRKWKYWMIPIRSEWCLIKTQKTKNIRNTQIQMGLSLFFKLLWNVLLLWVCIILF